MKTLPFALAFLISGLLIAPAFSQAPSPPSPQSDKQVGISSVDGITMSGNDMIITRNGNSEKLSKVLDLPNGIRVEPNGTITAKSGEKLMLRPTQVLTFDGRFLDIPIKSSVTPTAPVVPVQPGQQGQAPTGPTAQSQAAAVNQQNQVEAAAKIQDLKRANADAASPIKAGQSSPR